MGFEKPKIVQSEESDEQKRRRQVKAWGKVTHQIIDEAAPGKPQPSNWEISKRIAEEQSRLAKQAGISDSNQVSSGEFVTNVKRGIKPAKPKNDSNIIPPGLNAMEVFDREQRKREDEAPVLDPEKLKRFGKQK